MSDNGAGPMPIQITVQSDGMKVNTNANVPLDVAEGFLARALANVSREILITRLLQAEALREAAKPRISLAGGPMI